jgi:hypothetical protein
MTYWELHYFYNEKESGSYYIELNVESNEVSDNDVIQMAVDKKLIVPEDADYIDYVDEMEYEDYRQAKGIKPSNTEKFMKEDT